MRVYTKFKILVPFLLLSSTLLAQAQAPRPGVSFKRLFLDYQTLNGGHFDAFRKYTGGLEFSYLRPISEDLIIDIPVKIGMFGDKESQQSSVIGLDVHANYYPLSRERRLSPYLLAGVGAVMENRDSFHVQVPVGFGLDLKFAQNAFVTWQSEVRFATAEDRHNFHHSVGFKYFFGQPEEIVVIAPVLDTDADGISDDEDECPLVAGIAVFKGCPDSDNDGIRDTDDKCPEVPGLMEFNGCPDTDGDSISDAEDECPAVKGLIEYKGCPPPTDTDKDGIVDAKDRCPAQAGLPELDGCPDGDGDGITDAEDKCPTVKGKIEFQGCPDTDGDGIDDLADRCPTMAGPLDNGGCPQIEKKDKETLEFAMRAVQFEHGSARLKPESNKILNQVADILTRYPDYRLEINGHTDNTGSDDFNKRLSQDRAKSCYEYLSSKGISVRRMSYVGYGETRPIADNNSLNGRQLNRRVEFNLLPGK